MERKMLKKIPEIIEDYDEEIRPIREIGTSGIVLLFNYTLSGPQFFDSTYPTEWQEFYEQKKYYFRDPVLVWSILFTGDKRWSDIVLQKSNPVMKQAKKYGIVYGASFSRALNGRNSILSVSRPDREVTDEEMSFLSGWFDEIVMLVDGDSGLSDGEKEVLSFLNAGLNFHQISDELEISVPASKARARSARVKLKCLTTTQAVGRAVKRNYI
ncbi:autoinducer binding domain-containing protein [Pseudohalocynthiibacter aestuariivivens]|uniref:Autoinducer binding domain-containing protein n=1 Tax=Pseudohalocynthiibacter aestuariivivens TaxID=1591409 RepID=A0ABV5JHK9_9RHOB|nr:autoinducer binding domain-containing protein [Pseudohalocynthiibacter aestuariivivens]MBS9718969.1 autoinducer binding domain-containing protein [Pseudohalocynthiibacter aestuariivivens]